MDSEYCCVHLLIRVYQIFIQCVLSKLAIKHLILVFIFLRFYEAVVEEPGRQQMVVRFDGYTTVETVDASDVKKVATKRTLEGDDKYVSDQFVSKLTVSY